MIHLLYKILMGGGDKVGREREFEVGMDEAWKANIKRTYDEYQDVALGLTREMNAHINKVMSDAQTLTNQIQQNAIESANMVAKQAIRHADIAIDRQWNVDEVAQLVAKTPVFLDAIAAAVAQAITDNK